MRPEDFKEKLLNYEHLRTGLVVDGGLDLRGCTSLTDLPAGLVIKGDLDLDGCTSCPQGLWLKGT